MAATTPAATCVEAVTSPHRDDTASIPIWTSGTSIIDLPNEILRDIFLAIDGEFSKSLYSLSLTCKHFRAIVEEHCEPEYNLRGKWIDDPFALMERINGQPSLKDLIRVARMEYNYTEFTHYTEDEVDALVKSLDLDRYVEKTEETWGWPYVLSRDNGGPVWLCLLLSKVETIELTTRTTTPQTVRIPLECFLHDPHCYDYLTTHKFENLRNLFLAYPECTDRTYHTSGKDIRVSNLAFPRLRTAKLDGFAFCHDGWPAGYEGVSPVEELHIQDNQEMYDYNDNDIHWDKFQSLKVLHLHIGFVYIFYERYQEPPRYVNALSRRHGQSLEEFYLYSNELYCQPDGTYPKMSDYCPGQPSLKDFSVLKSLALTDMSLMGVSKSTGPVHWQQDVKLTLQHLADMFPSTLESFTHLVWDGTATFYRAITEKEKATSSWARVWKRSDQNRFPNLKKVMVQKYGLYGLSEEKEVIWERKT